MRLPSLTFKSINARAVVLKLKRPIVARIATMTDWPLILIDFVLRKASSVAATWNPTPSKP